MIDVELHQSAISYLNSCFDIKLAINCREFDVVPQVLINKLKKYQGRSFGTKEKILLVHMDTDYYDPLLPCGTIPINLIRIFKNLDISLSSILFVSNHFGIKKEFDHLLRDHHPMDRPQVVQTLLSPQLLKERLVDKDMALDFESIQKSAICMMGKSRSHRVALYNFFVDNNLFDKIAVSQHFSVDCHDYTKKQKIKVAPKEINSQRFPSWAENLLTTLPKNRINDVFVNPGSRLNFSPVHTPMKDPIIQGKPFVDHIGYADFYKKIGIDIVSESVMKYPYPFITEKTYRPIASGRPFISIGPAGTLDFLKSLGFNTFPCIIDESYDKIENPEKRFIKICESIMEFVNRPIDDIINDIKKVEHDLKHNLACLHDLPAAQLIKFKEQIKLD